MDRNVQEVFSSTLIPEENIATMKYGAQMEKGQMKSALSDGDTQNYDLDHGFSRHLFDDDCHSGIEIMPCQPSISNHIRILLLDRDSRSHSYSIEVSMDELDWIRVIDHSRYLAHVSRYIQIVGTHNTVNKSFHIVALERMFTNKAFTLEEGLIVPMENIVNTADSASMIEGVSRGQNTLLKEDTKNSDWDSGYTCHQLGSGTIGVQLSQSYIIGSMWLLLWDCEDQSYSYYVEVSTNQQQWTTVAKRTKVTCKSWQSVTFERQSTSFIRIVGTHSTANKVFHYVHFECPEQQSSQKEENSEELGTGDTSLAPSGNSLPSSPGSSSYSAIQQHR
uniref:F5/8 type C domain-containing protein n=1 Tax=Monodon monoceros TaxID=40151 RepID=A0A8C6AX93_MONMO